jgi:hypothetical protein
MEAAIREEGGGGGGDGWGARAAGGGDTAWVARVDEREYFSGARGTRF